MRAGSPGTDQIRYQVEFKAWIRSRGVGSKNRIGDSIDSYVAYLRRASKELRMEIGPRTVRSRTDAETIKDRLLERGVTEGTARNCRTALNHYADMVQAKNLF